MPQKINANKSKKKKKKNATSTVKFTSFLPLSLLPISSGYLPLSQVFSYQSKLSYIYTSFVSLNSFKYIKKELFMADSYWSLTENKIL